MARAGVFQDLDAVLTWHPGDRNAATTSSTLANISARFRFAGQAAHASTAPHMGRSALDAVQLMNYSVELLREHVPDSARIHYIITQGGSAPNIVPDAAESYYVARHPSITGLDGVWARIIKCAEAAALATETRLEMRIVASVYNILPNDALSALLHRNLQAVGGVLYSRQEQEFGEALRRTFPTEGRLPLGSQEQIQTREEGQGLGSTDVGDVSWLVPTASLTAATYVPGTPGHSWQSTACAGGSIGRKGMVVAAKTLALTGLDLFTEPRHLADARASFLKRRGSEKYRSRIPADQKPPLDYRRR